jgi:hypothetical protein
MLLFERHTQAKEFCCNGFGPVKTLEGDVDHAVTGLHVEPGAAAVVILVHRIIVLRADLEAPR